ncbi:uncharacterized protein LOC102349787 [Latimeria chalumnae]|uniref:uncharacterized protein LOC102349787 n=1 Tax=Latimeria chalumnae TaxID=7897 RepID=UPI0003C19F6F|nr:PREDICTED: uncharacterized protein C17orf80 homolog [Latimeria chalumnae]XP_005988122.1 PREDICTED: uncharacterized protein C17orf80 homolog [Latimeria chalumnae]XP_014350309.1 PREDICTED: uncharacterized protein C17orf80 homolog [Latimeria chalumnae]|eukprot:XP_005988121.1 PREDICTED: uncharacterized protein C17orf80 homolog [Latimeria chalumnae]
MGDPPPGLETCPFCGKPFKRLKSHLPHCKMAGTGKSTLGSERRLAASRPGQVTAVEDKAQAAVRPKRKSETAPSKKAEPKVTAPKRKSKKSSSSASGLDPQPGLESSGYLDLGRAVREEPPAVKAGGKKVATKGTSKGSEVESGKTKEKTGEERDEPSKAEAQTSIEETAAKSPKYGIPVIPKKGKHSSKNGGSVARSLVLKEGKTNSENAALAITSLTEAPHVKPTQLKAKSGKQDTELKPGVTAVTPPSFVSGNYNLPGYTSGERHTAENTNKLDKKVNEQVLANRKSLRRWGETLQGFGSENLTDLTKTSSAVATLVEDRSAGGVDVAHTIVWNHIRHSLYQKKPIAQYFHESDKQDSQSLVKDEYKADATKTSVWGHMKGSVHQKYSNDFPAMKMSRNSKQIELFAPALTLKTNSVTCLSEGISAAHYNSEGLHQSELQDFSPRRNNGESTYAANMKKLVQSQEKSLRATEYETKKRERPIVFYPEPRHANSFTSTTNSMPSCSTQRPGEGKPSRSTGLEWFSELYPSYCRLTMLPVTLPEWDMETRTTIPHRENLQVPLTQRRMMDVKLGELPAWLGTRDLSPSGVQAAIQAGCRRYYNKYINVKRGGFGGITMLLVGYCVLSYTWNYEHLKHSRWRKYH